MDLDIQVSKLKLLKANHTSQRYRLEDNIAKHYPAQIATLKERLAGYQTDIQTYTAHKPQDKEHFSIKIGNRIYTEKKEAGAALIEMCRSAKKPGIAVAIGEYQGFKMSVTFEPFFQKFTLQLKGNLSHEVELGADPFGNLQRMNNALEAMPGKLSDIEKKLSNVEHQLETAKVEVTKPFPQEQELKEKLERLSELNALLNMDEKGNDAIGMGDEPETGKQVGLDDAEAPYLPEPEALETPAPASAARVSERITALHREEKPVDVHRERVSVRAKLAEMNARIGRDKGGNIQKEQDGPETGRNKWKEAAL